MANSSMLVLAATIAPAAPQAVDDRGIERRGIPFENPRRAGRRLLGGHDVVLERDRHRVERAPRDEPVDTSGLGVEQPLRPVERRIEAGGVGGRQSPAGFPGDVRCCAHSSSMAPSRGTR